jgi:hypothetical protein
MSCGPVNHAQEPSRRRWRVAVIRSFRARWIRPAHAIAPRSVLAVPMISPDGAYRTGHGGVAGAGHWTHPSICPGCHPPDDVAWPAAGTPGIIGQAVTGFG